MINWQKIIAACKKSDPGAQEELYRYAYEPMLKVCLRYARDVDEAGAIYNEGMMKVFSSIDQYKGKGEFEGWIRRIMVNTSIDHVRREAKFSHQSLEYQDGHEKPVPPEVYERISSNEIIGLLQNLPRNSALVFNLFVLEGYRHEEIGKLLGISEGTSKWHLNEARRLLRSALETLLKNETYSHVV